MSTPSDALLHEIKADAATTLASVKVTLEGLLIELKSAQRRNFDSSDFVIDEFRRLTHAIEALTQQLLRLP